MRSLKIFTAVYASLVIASCDTLPKVEGCTFLGDSWICSDERLNAPPAGCSWSDDKEKDYECPPSYGVGYQATSIRDYQTLADHYDDIIKENRRLKRECQ